MSEPTNELEPGEPLTTEDVASHVFAAAVELQAAWLSEPPREVLLDCALPAYLFDAASRLRSPGEGLRDALEKTLYILDAVLFLAHTKDGAQLVLDSKSARTIASARASLASTPVLSSGSASGKVGEGDAEAAATDWPRLPEWNDLTNEQRGTIRKEAEYWTYEAVAGDAAVNIYRSIREAVLVPLPPLIFPFTAPAPSSGVERGASFQARVKPWMMECFGPVIPFDKLERGDRFLEEALELLQSGGYPRERVAALVDYVFNRPAGEPSQEVGGVMVTLAAYCVAFGLDMADAGEAELARINQPEIIEKIRAKQAAKPTGSALPVAEPLPPSDLGEQAGMREAIEQARELRAFLDGTGQIDGCGFGENPPGARGNFWWRKHLNRIDAILPLLPAREGWKLVPVEPTPEMLAAFWWAKNGHYHAGEPPPTDTSDYAAYRAMLSAARVSKP